MSKFFLFRDDDKALHIINANAISNMTIQTQAGNKEAYQIKIFFDDGGSLEGRPGSYEETDKEFDRLIDRLGVIDFSDRFGN